ncbi:MAG: glycosyltransferase [Alphaproteobacteria bacterium]|nr:glycosyltransferase [Alphaproteobacteria bacterium]
MKIFLRVLCSFLVLLLLGWGIFAISTSHRPAVSVVMAVYNCEKYLDQNITSVLTQNFSDFEFIIVNDASTDRSQEIIDKYAKQDKRIRAYKNKNNSGAAATRNEGLKHIRGKYTLVIDSDDALEPRALEISYKRAERDNLDVFMFQAKGFNDKIQQFEYVAVLKRLYFKNHNLKIFSSRHIIDNIFQITLLFAWNKFIRTDLIKKNNLHFAAHTYYDDSYFTVMALLKAERISYTEEELYLYRFNRAGSQTSKYSDNEKLSGKLELAKALRSEFKKMNVPVGAYGSLIKWMSISNYPYANSKLKKDVRDFLDDTAKNYISLRADNAN